MNYNYFNDGNFSNTYNLVENPTNQVIAYGIVGAVIQSLTSHLNRGAGFDGWTPAFFLNTIKVNERDY